MGNTNLKIHRPRRSSSKKSSRPTSYADEENDILTFTRQLSEAINPSHLEEIVQSVHLSLKASLQNNYHRTSFHLPSLPWCRNLTIFSNFQMPFQLHTSNSSNGIVTLINNSLDSLSSAGTSASPFNTLRHPKCQIVATSEIIGIPGTQDPRRILILGDPGCGKTTLSLTLAHDWATLSLDKNYLFKFEFVFLIQLRHLHSTSVLQFVEDKVRECCQQLDEDMPRDLIRRKLMNTIRNSSSVLFILDGFDELPKNVTCSSSVRKMINNNSFPLATVIVTSRYSYNVHPENFGRVLFLKGLSWEHVIHFSKQLFLDSNCDVESALLQLYRHTYSLGDLLRCPLYLILFCNLIVGKKFSSSDTIAELYIQAINYIVGMTLEIDFDIRTDSSYQTLNKLGELCLCKLNRGTLLFSDHELAVIAQNDDVFRLGLFTVVNEPGSSIAAARKKIYQPIHSSFVDFIAAYYLWTIRNNWKLFFTSVTNLFQGGIYGERDIITFLAGLLGKDEVGLLLKCLPSFYLEGRIGRACKLVCESHMSHPDHLAMMVRNMKLTKAEILISAFVNLDIAAVLDQQVSFPLSSVSVSMAHESVTSHPYLRPLEIAAVLGASKLDNLNMTLEGSDEMVLNFSTNLLNHLIAVPFSPQPTFTLVYTSMPDNLAFALKDFLTGKKPNKLYFYYTGKNEERDRLHFNFLDEEFRVLSEKLQYFTFSNLRNAAILVPEKDMTKLLKEISTCLCLKLLKFGGISWSHNLITCLVQSLISVHPSTLSLARGTFITHREDDATEKLAAPSSFAIFTDHLGRWSCRLTALDLQRSVLTSDDVLELEKAVASNKYLSTLNLSFCVDHCGNSLTFHLDTFHQQPRLWEDVILSGWQVIFPHEYLSVLHSRLQIEQLHIDCCAFEDCSERVILLFTTWLEIWKVVILHCDLITFTTVPKQILNPLKTLESIHLHCSVKGFGLPQHFQSLERLTSLRSLHFCVSLSSVECFSLYHWEKYLVISNLNRIHIDLEAGHGDSTSERSYNSCLQFLDIVRMPLSKCSCSIRHHVVGLLDRKFTAWKDLYNLTIEVMEQLAYTSKVEFRVVSGLRKNPSFEIFLEKIQKWFSTYQDSFKLFFHYDVESMIYKLYLLKQFHVKPIRV